MLETVVEWHFRDVIEVGHVGLPSLGDMNFRKAVDFVDPKLKHHNYIIMQLNSKRNKVILTRQSSEYNALD